MRPSNLFFALGAITLAQATTSEVTEDFEPRDINTTTADASNSRFPAPGQPGQGQGQYQGQGRGQPQGQPQGGNCPAVWQTIGQDLVPMMLDTNMCNDFARGAIRAAFHDCGTWDKAQGDTGGCDGSLFLAQEYTNEENRGLADTVPRIGALAQKYNVGVADMFQFAGGKHFLLYPQA